MLGRPVLGVSVAEERSSAATSEGSQPGPVARTDGLACQQAVPACGDPVPEAVTSLVLTAYSVSVESMFSVSA